MKSILLVTTLFLLSPSLLQPNNKTTIKGTEQVTKLSNSDSQANQEEFIFDFGESAVSENGLFECKLIYNLGKSINLRFRGNIEVLKEKHDINQCVMVLSLPREQGQLDISIVHNGGRRVISVYSSLSSDGFYHVSSLSQYAADFAAGNIENQEYFDNNTIDSVDIGPTPDFESGGPVIHRAIGSGRVYGYLRWTDAQANTHPLIGARVKLTFDLSWGNVTTYTNSSGYYDLSFSNMWTASFDFVTTIHIYADCDQCGVANSSGTLYEKTFRVSGLSSSTPYEQSYTFDPTTDGDLGKAMNIFTAARNYSEYARNLNGGSSIAKCTVRYPTTDGSVYINGENYIRLGNESQRSSTSRPAVYACWDTIGHEYGHHLQKHFFNRTYSGPHTDNTNDFYEYLEGKNTTNSSTYVLPSSDYSNAKKQSMGLAWKESWPTFFAISAQDSFDGDIKSIATVGDSTYDSYNGVVTNLNGMRRCGEMDENTIMMFLYQLWDTANSGQDNISISDSDLWTVMVSTNPEFFSSFISALYGSGLSFDRWSLGRLLEYFKFSASSILVSVSQTNYANVPTIHWTRNGYDVSYLGQTYSLSNDKFDIFFYASDNSEIFHKTHLSGSSYTLSSKEWNDILIATGNTYKIMIKAYDSFGIESGPYYSDVHEYSKPSGAEVSLSLNTDAAMRYFEKTIAIAPGTKWKMHLNFPYAGKKAIQTFGGADTMIWLYQADGHTLIDSDDDSGYGRDGYGKNAYLLLDAEANVDYVLEVGLYGDDVGAKTKVTITPFAGDLEHGYSTFNCFKSFLNINTYHNFTWYSGLSPHCSSVLTWTPPANGNYTISLESNFDNYLYVIDPADTEPIVANVHYNDDYSGLNAGLTNDYLASKTYYVIYCQLHPGAEYSNRSITVRFQINQFN